MPTPYTGPSIVDYLTSTGQASDYNSRAALAGKYGITNYSGSADQNTQLLNSLRNAGTTTPAAPGAGGTTGAPNTGTTTVPAPSNPVQVQVNANSILNSISSGQIDPNAIDSYIKDQVLNSYRTAYNGGTGDNRYLNEYNASGSGLETQIKNMLIGKSFSYGGQQYQYTNAGVQKTSTTVNQSTTNGAGTTSTQSAIPGAGTTTPIVAPTAPVISPAAPAAPVAPAVAPPAVGAPALPVAGAPGGTTGPGASTYTGPSVVDYLNSVGQSSDYASRARMAASMGIQGYTGTAAQNTQLLNGLRSSQGGNNSSTTAAGAGAGASGTAPGTTGTTNAGGTGAGLDGDTASVLANATAIAKSFGWTAPDPKNSPLNIATNLFTQGLAAFGLVDLKTQINNVLQQQTDLQNKKADEAADVNSNPWLTEGERVARLSKLDDKYATKLDILVHQQQLSEADYKTGLDQVQWQVGQAMSAYNIATTANDKLYSDALSVAENILQSQNTLKSQTATANKPIEVSAGNTLYDPKTGKPIYTAPSKATGAGLTTPATNDAAVRAGVDVETFKGYPADVQAYFSQKSDAAIDPIRTALTEVATGKKKAADFNKQIADGEFGAMSPAVQSFLKAQAIEAEKAAPPPGEPGFLSKLWDSIW